jgi:hypothetical protein
MELVTGGDLANLIAILREHGKQLTEPQISFITAEVKPSRKY